MFLACTAAIPGMAQNASPQCGATNLDPARNVFTVIRPEAGAVNQQCFLTVYPKGAQPEQARQFPASYLVEGNYVIELSGGGGGGAGGALKDKGGGGGGAGAAPSRTLQYLTPGVYKLTLGTGGDGGSANGGTTNSGNPTSLTNAKTGQLVYGFSGADMWTQESQAAKGAGHGGAATAGGSSGGDGGDSGPRSEEAAESGGASQTAGYAGKPGQSGNENGHSTETTTGSVVQANAGGGGGAGAGSGGAGESANSSSVAGVGDLGGGGGGGRGGLKTADHGGRGGHGYIRLTMAAPELQRAAPAAKTVVLTRVVQRYTLSSDTLFGFGQSKLKTGGNTRLDELVDKLKEVNIERITATGHSDRIGSEETNQKVSERRADSVKAYLVRAGTPSDRISAVGLGETRPATGPDDCLGRATPKVIACLQPDRRVEIEVVGTKITP